LKCHFKCDLKKKKEKTLDKLSIYIFFFVSILLFLKKIYLRVESCFVFNFITMQKRKKQNKTSFNINHQLYFFLGVKYNPIWFIIIITLIQKVKWSIKYLAQT